MTTNTNEKESKRKLITRADAAQRYSFSLRHIDNLICAGLIPTVKLSKKCVRIPVDQADAAFDQLVTGGRSK